MLKSAPYGRVVSSAILNQPGTFAFPLGRLEIEAVNGADGTALVGWVLQLRRRLGDGSTVHVTTAVTNRDGRVRLDPLPLEVDEAWIVRAPSPIDGSAKESPALLGFGAHRFTVGGPPLVVTLRNAIYRTRLAGERVTVHERLASGQTVTRRTTGTDTAGILRLDLAGLGEGRTYVLRTSPYGHSVQSNDLTQAGQFEFQVSKLEVAVVGAAANNLLVGRLIQMTRQEVSGDLTPIASYVTDTQGRIRIDPSPLSEGQAWVFRTTSPIDGTLKDSPPIVAFGSYRYAVGNLALTLRLKNSISGNALAGVTVRIYEQLLSGEQRYVRRSETDASGELVLDLDRLGAGARYVARAAPYGRDVTSAPTYTTGTFDFPVGRLQLDVERWTPLVGQGFISVK